MAFAVNWLGDKDEEIYDEPTEAANLVVRVISRTQPQGHHLPDHQARRMQGYLPPKNPLRNVQQQQPGRPARRTATTVAAKPAPAGRPRKPRPKPAAAAPAPPVLRESVDVVGNIAEYLARALEVLRTAAAGKVHDAWRALPRDVTQLLVANLHVSEHQAREQLVARLKRSGQIRICPHTCSHVRGIPRPAPEAGEQ